MASPSGSREKDALSIHQHSGTVTSVIRVEAIETASSSGWGSQDAAMSPRSIDPPGSLTRGRATSIHLEPPPSRRGRKGITVHWPFQSIVTDNLSIFTTPGPELFRRATWQPPRQLGSDGTDSVVTSPRDSTLIPDYVVNFIRGETPETVARRKKNGGTDAAVRAVDMTHQHRPQRSHAALFEDAQRAEMMVEYGNANGHGNGMMIMRGSDDLSHGGSAGTSSVGSETRHMLPIGSRQSNRSGRGGWKSLTTGWRSGVVLNLLLVVMLLLTGFVCLVVAGTKIALLVGDMDLYTGSCAKATNMNWGLHALINVAVVILMVGANYVFQVLSSPTRSEVASAHQHKKWLEIGVPSARNFKHIGKGRVFLSLLLLTVAVVTQIIYNSVIFTSETGLSYNLIAVESSFLTGSPFSNVSSSNSAGLTRELIQELQGDALAGSHKLNNLTVPACASVFTGAFNADYRNLLLVIDGNDQSNSLVATARAGIGESPSSAADLASTSDTNTEIQILVDGAQVEYCLGQPTTADEEVCTVKLNGVLLAILLGLHLVTFFATAASLLLARFDPLVTLGDALSSFLRDPDPTTRMNGLLTKENLRTNMGGWGFTEGKYWVPQREHRWFRSPSLTQWLIAGFWWILTLCLVAGVLALTVASSTVTTSSSSSSMMPTTTTILSRFGVPSAHSTFLVSNTSTMDGSNLAIITSLPQLLLAGLYFSTNALLTAFFLTRESSRYAILFANAARRPLRVSADPQGLQTTSLYLTLPRPVSWALAIWFAAMGFVLSQSCFVVSMTSTTSTSKLLGVGFSSLGLLLLLLQLLVLLAVVLGLAFFCKAPAAIQATGQAIGNPLVFDGGSCSAVMSARCHRIPGETDVWKGHLCWGVVPEMGDAPTSHVTYSARPLMEMDGHHRYV